MTRIYALFGNPVAHSLSPAFQQAGFDALALAASYELRPVEADDMAAAADEMRRQRIAGANITVPHKRRALELADVASAVAQSIGAANAWALDSGQLAAFNTDAGGLRLALELLGLDAPERAVILGSGGAANAAAFALAGSPVSVIARDIGSATDVYAEAGALRRCATWGSSAARHMLSEASLVVDATSLAHAPLTSAEAAYASLGLDAVTADASVYSLSYGHGLDSLRAALDPAVVLHDGLSMLLLQGALSFRLWTGERPPLREMAAALENGAPQQLPWREQLDDPSAETALLSALGRAPI